MDKNSRLIIRCISFLSNYSHVTCWCNASLVPFHICLMFLLAIGLLYFLFSIIYQISCWSFAYSVSFPWFLSGSWKYMDCLLNVNFSKKNQNVIKWVKVCRKCWYSHKVYFLKAILIQPNIYVHISWQIQESVWHTILNGFINLF